MPPSEICIEHTATVGTRDVGYLVCGQEGPVVVVLHADGDAAATAYAGLAPGRRLVLLDVRGIDDPAEVDDLLDGLEVDGVVGVGRGAEGALRLVARTPTARTVVLVSPPAQILPVHPPSGDDVPTLVVYGDDDARLAGPPPHRDLPSVPGAATVLVYAAGRDVAVDRPSAFAAVVGDFLDRGVGFARSATSSVLNP